MRHAGSACGLGVCAAVFFAACDRPREESAHAAPAPPAPIAEPRSGAAPPPADLPAAVRILVDATRARIRLGEVYDPAYYPLAYPGGDVPGDRGVCTDVVIRAYRHLGIDLQVLVHEDMRRNFLVYPPLWGNTSTDRNIDHRRVPNLETFFKRAGAALPIGDRAEDFRPGDLVTWRLAGGLPHIGIVSDRRVPGSLRPLILHNIGAGTAEDDILFRYPIAGHFRFLPGGT